MIKNYHKIEKNEKISRGNVTVVVGGQFGSEAKGKVISFLADEFDIAVRTGSPNAGHTVLNSGKTYRLRQIPSTFINPNCILCIGAGALISLDVLNDEVKITGTVGRLLIDPQAGIIEDKHVAQERRLVQQIGGTGKGCGAALVHRIWRDDFKLAKNVLKGYKITNVADFLNEGINNGKNIIVEGTQGFGLSIYHGIYPYVTSRDTTAAKFLAEAGLSPTLVKEIILVIRTYPIRVAGNSGPLKNEISWDVLSNRIGNKVEELTTVTRKVRRVAEFDIGVVKKAIQINRPTQIALQFLNYLFPRDKGKKSWESLSDEAKKYIKKLERKLGVPITLIGTSKSSSGMIDLRDKTC